MGPSLYATDQAKRTTGRPLASAGFNGAVAVRDGSVSSLDGTYPPSCGRFNGAVAVRDGSVRLQRPHSAVKQYAASMGPSLYATDQLLRYVGHDVYDFRASMGPSLNATDQLRAATGR